MKKILFITYHWPPSGGITVLRPLKFAKYLKLYGWEPIIFTAKNPSYQIIDESLISDVPKDLVILKSKILEPYSIYKALTLKKSKFNAQDVINIETQPLKLLDKLAKWIRANLFIPDGRALWIKPAVKFLLKYLTKNKIDVIYSNGPPHTNTVIASLVAQKTQIPWIADFQDPWTTIGYGEFLPFSKRALQKHRELENMALNTASKIITVSENWREEFKKLTSKPVYTIPWGYDEEDFYTLKINSPNDENFSISHVGTLGIDRLPIGLIYALDSLFKKDINFRKKFIFNIVGQVDYRIKAEINKYPFKDSVRYYGQLNRPQALELMATSSVLLLIVNTTRDSLGRIPAKTFEYLRVQKPILCLTEPHSSVAKIISEYKGHLIANHNDTHRIEKYLEYNFYNKVSINNSLFNLDVKTLTKRLSSIL